jgi:hypothetical protein
MMKTINLLCVHGVGHQEMDPEFRAAWSNSIRTAIQSCDPGIDTTIDFLEYDSLFEHAPLNPLTYGLAFGKLLMSSAVHGIGDTIAGARGIGEVPEAIKWSAGMVAQWATEDKLRAATRELLLKQVKVKAYDAVFAHSLGSLISYDTFLRNPAAIDGRMFVSLGSQIGNPAVRDVFAGRLETLAARKWYHLFNPDDHVMTCAINIAAANFQQVEVQFDIPNDVLNHNATWYLGQANTIATVWRELAGTPQPRSFGHATRSFAKAMVKPNRRALLIGINDYPDPANRLEGCVNDVFTMSAVLQEGGFDPGDIRVVLDDRATTQGINDRLHWLLDGVRAGDERVLFYSGHGAQIPGYGAKGEPDHLDECLVPYDFDWSPAHAILDKQFCELYSQLPYESRFVAMFDCCHSGGLTRDGGPRIRGLTPPDDIRHRALRWEASEQMWVARDFPPINRSLAEKKNGQNYLGNGGAMNRIGRAAELRGQPNAEYDAIRKTLGHHGPYLPILLEACQEQEFSYEYRNGAVSYGAYTWCMAQALRDNVRNGIAPTYAALTVQVGDKLRRLKYNQTPALVGAKARVAEAAWGATVQPAARKRAATSRRK